MPYTPFSYLIWWSSLEIWVAIKIMTAESCTEQSRELSALRSSQQNGTSEHIVRLLGSFIHQGPNGSHQCLVFELLGPTVDHVVSDYHASGDRLEPENILQVTKQLLQGVASIHRAGYAHGGSLGYFPLHEQTRTNISHVPRH